MRMQLLALVVVAGCGGRTPPAKPVVCDDPAPGTPMTEEMCTCRKGAVQLSVGGAVELHCEPGDVDLGPVRLGARDGWCCKPR